MVQIRKADENLEFALKDYRDEQGCYDHIISVGMLDHVGFCF